MTDDIFLLHRIASVDYFLKRLFEIYVTVMKQGYKEVNVVMVIVVWVWFI